MSPRRKFSMHDFTLRRFLLVVLLALPLLIPVNAFAQEATIGGTVTDATGGVLPGVVVRAVNDATGNSFEGVTDAAGIYRITVRIGTYRVEAELSGFAPVVRNGVPAQVGQQSTL